MPNTVAICQSNYIPWKGYFDLIRSVDEFILYDDAQFTKNDWRNRNKIRTPEGTAWLTIPVDTSGKFGQAIKDTKVASTSWHQDHWKTIRQNYHGARYFRDYEETFARLYHEAGQLRYLSEINHLFLIEMNRLLGIQTPLRWSMDFKLPEGKSERLVYLCRELNATEYLSGPAAKSYLDVSRFRDQGIQVRWANYDDYPKYTQCFDGFEHHVSAVDLLLNVGPQVIEFMKKI
jgi:hypothetical protein